MEMLPSHEMLLRAVFFGALLSLILILELMAPRRSLTLARISRWLPNLGLGALNILLLKLLLPMLGLGLAVLAEAEEWGLLNRLSVPAVIAVPASLLVLDLTIWAQHRLFHRVPLLWRMHRMHHTDPDFDATTAVRFHPLEAMLSMLIKSAVIVLLGVGPVAFLVFEVLLSSTSLFNHGNFRMPSGLDRALRWIIVTPDMHRVHHSIRRREQNSNFGFNLPWWDRLFGTYADQPHQGHEHMIIGTGNFGDVEEQHLSRLLSQPFRTA